MNRIHIFSFCFFCSIFISSVNGNDNKIDWLKLPQLEGSGYGVSEIETKTKKIGELSDFADLLNFDNVLISGVSKIKGIKKINVDIKSSSFLNEKNVFYDGVKVFDGNLKTAWCEGVKGFGFKEWVKFDIQFESDDKISKFKDGMCFNHVIIFPGLGMSEDLFYKNNRIKSLLLVITTKEYCKDSKTNKIKLCKYTSAFRLKFEDINKYQAFRIEDPDLIAKEFEIYLYIEDVYKGSQFDDTCISEIKFLF